MEFSAVFLSFYHVWPWAISIFLCMPLEEGMAKMEKARGKGNERKSRGMGADRGLQTLCQTPKGHQRFPRAFHQTKDSVSTRRLDY